MSDATSETEADQGNQTTSSIKSFLSGGCGGVAAVVVGKSPIHVVSLIAGPTHSNAMRACELSIILQITGHPFDLTKVRLQTAPQGTYSGALDVVKKTLARDGVKGCV
jgi:solute carrier family 25 carnitine/acylcarnitine transporter 20/29